MQSSSKSCDVHMTGGSWLFFSERDWRNCEDQSLALGQFEGQSCELAFDFSGLCKLGCIARIFTKVIDREVHYFSVAPRFWVSRHHPALEKLPKEWVDQGLIKVASRDSGYYQEVLEEVKLESGINLVRGSTIDPYGAHLLSRGIAEDGLSPIVTVHNYANMSRPMKELAAAIESGRFHHDGNPVMNWCISNVVGKCPPGGNLVRPVKQDCQREISGAVALIMAIESALKCDTVAQKAPHIEFYLKQTEYKSEISGADLRIGLGITVRGDLLTRYFVRYEADYPAAPITQWFNDNEGKDAFVMYNSIVLALK